MLVLSRKVGQRVLIGDNISVTVVRLSGGGVRLGIDAPPEMAVIRQELKEKLESVAGDEQHANADSESVCPKPIIDATPTARK